MAVHPNSLKNLRRTGRKLGSRNAPNAVSERVRKAASAKTAKAVKVLVQLMDDDGAPPSVRLQAATAILDRAVGRPRQAVEVTDDTDRRTLDRGEVAGLLSLVRGDG